jgi:hypothetical protein
LDKAGQAEITRDTMMPIKATSTSIENSQVTLWKKKSCKRWRLTTIVTRASEEAVGVGDMFMSIPWV